MVSEIGFHCGITETLIKQLFFLGSKHLYKLVSLSRQLLSVPGMEKDYTEVKKAIWNNNYYAHCEAILLAMIADEDPEKRKLAVELILKARRNMVPGAKVREYRPPNEYEMKLDCSSYDQMIDLKVTAISEPPALMKLSEQELQDIACGKRTYRLGRFYCHTVDCERAVSQTTQASQSVVSV